MAPMQGKRARALTGDVEAVNGHERGQKSRRKRARVAPEEDSGSATSSEVASQESSSETAEDDGGNEDEDEEDERFTLQTQRVERQLRNNEHKQNTPSECGIIEEIRCTNFMCHEQLTVPLGPLINFIIGHNGSGKSAVLTALTLCLGGKATATNRGQNLKSFIKEGRDQCSLAVKIKNQGAAAYKPDIYGRSIIVERSFNRAGTSGFKLKDANGKIVSNKKSDVEDIVDAFALQIDNPMNVLTQDMARQFLNDSNAKQKYGFFLKGTQLQTLLDDYNLISSELDEMQSKSETIRTDVDFLKKRYEEAVRQAKQAANLETMRAREKSFAHQAAWASVEEEERSLSKIDEEIEHVAQLIEQRTAAADQQSEQYEVANGAWSELNQSIQEREAELEPLKQECNEFHTRFIDTKNELMKLKGTEREIAGKIQNKAKAIGRYASQIQEHRQRQAEADNGQHALKLQELEEAKENYERVKESLTNHDSGFQSLNDELHSAKRKREAAESGVREKQSEVQRYKESIRDLEHGGQRNWMESYPNPASLSTLLKKIGEERRFRERPIGPMGRYVKLLKPEWSSILEKTLGANLNAFVVTSKADQGILSELMRKTNCSSYPIYIGKNDQIDTSGNEPDPDLDTWLRVLTIENNLVRNQMIINNSIDQIVLIKDRATAEEFMHRGGPPRRNVKVCLTMHDRDPNKGHAINLNASSGNISIGPIMSWPHKTRMQADKGPQLQAARNNLERVERELHDLQAGVADLRLGENRCKRNIEAHARQKRDFTLQFQQAQEEVERLDSELSAATPDAGMIEQLEESLQEAEREKEFEEGQFQDIILQMDKLNAENRENKSNLEAAQKHIQQLKDELSKASAKRENAKNKREDTLRKKNLALEEVQKAQDNKSEWEQERDKQMATIESTMSEARQICERVEVPTGETFNSLHRRLQRLQREREESERQLGGSEQDLLAAANAAKKGYSDAKRELSGTLDVIRYLKNSLVHRQKRWEKFRQEISVRSRITFTYLLSERQFRGDLKVDHRSQALDIHVQPDITVLSSTGRQTKTLSGGEKSFSTICLLLSLWDAMGSPIRCLDEFDVFMDSVNRDISMKMMIQAARRAIGRQYILITPQAMNNVQSMDDVRIIRMNDPERGQTALNIRR